MTTETNSSPSSDDLSTRLAVPEGRWDSSYANDPTGWSKISREARDATGLSQDDLAEAYNNWISSLPEDGQNPHQFKAFLAGATFSALVPAPEPARVLDVTEEIRTAARQAFWKAGPMPWCGEGQYDPQHRLNAALDAVEAALRTSPPETVGGGDGKSLLREAWNAIQGLLETPEIADALPEDKDGETHEAESAARRCIARLEAALSSAPPAEETWQAIKTAPKDGTDILYRASDGSIGHCHWSFPINFDDDEQACWWDRERDDEVYPVWWMRPLPPGPAGEAK